MFVQVKKRTSNFNNYDIGSHVMEYGSKNLTDEKLYLYQGFDPASVNFPPNNDQLEQYMEVVNQRDAEIFFMWQLVSSSLGLFLSSIVYIWIDHTDTQFEYCWGTSKLKLSENG